MRPRVLLACAQIAVSPPATSLASLAGSLQVYKGFWGGALVAVKVANLLNQNSATLIKEFAREVKVMSGLPPHDNVVRLLAACTQLPRLALVTGALKRAALRATALHERTHASFSPC